MRAEDATTVVRDVDHVKAPDHRCRRSHGATALLEPYWIQASTLSWFSSTHLAAASSGDMPPEAM